MTDDGIYVDPRPLILPPLDRSRKNDDDFWDDLMAVGNELRTTIAECATLVPVAKIESVNLAVLMGMMVRLHKLFDTYLLLISKRRMEMAMIIARCAYDTSIDILYFCYTKDQSKIVDFIDTTLATSKRIYEDVERDEKIGKGDSVVRERIKSSVEDDFQKAGRKLGDVQSANWQRKESVFDRAKAVDLAGLHTFLFKNLSRLVHGSWSELVKYHLWKDGESWHPNLNYAIPCPQIMSSFPILLAMAAKVYAEDVSKCQPMADRLQKIIDWFLSMSDRHETFLRADRSG